MSRDQIVDDVRAVRDKIAREHDYDLAAIFEALRALGRERSEGRVTLTPRRVPRQETGAVQQGAAADGALPPSSVGPRS
jgi:hypothetical protein